MNVGRNVSSAMTKTVFFIKNHKIENHIGLDKRTRNMTMKRGELQNRIAVADARMDELTAIRKVITDYRKTRDIYIKYHESGWSKDFYEEHKEQTDMHIAAKHAYDSAHGKMPRLIEIAEEFDKLKSQKQANHADLKELNGQLRELMNVKSNIVELLGAEENGHDSLNTDQPDQAHK